MIKPYAPAGIPRKTAVALRPATHYPQMVLLYGVYQRQHGPHLDLSFPACRGASSPRQPVQRENCQTSETGTRMIARAVAAVGAAAADGAAKCQNRCCDFLAAPSLSCQSALLTCVQTIFQSGRPSGLLVARLYDSSALRGAMTGNVGPSSALRARHHDLGSVDWAGYCGQHQVYRLPLRREWSAQGVR